jgi:hypothetical protein
MTKINFNELIEIATSASKDPPLPTELFADAVTSMLR